MSRKDEFDVELILPDGCNRPEDYDLSRNPLVWNFFMGLLQNGGEGLDEPKDQTLCV